MWNITYYFYIDFVLYQDSV